MRRLSTMLAAGAVLAIALGASGVGADEHLTATEIKAHPLVKLSEPGNLLPKATLTVDGLPLAGKTVEFRTPGPPGMPPAAPICIDVTDEAGVASCDEPANLGPVIQNQGTYVAYFFGDETYAPSSQRSGLIGE